MQTQWKRLPKTLTNWCTAQDVELVEWKGMDQGEGRNPPKSCRNFRIISAFWLPESVSRPVYQVVAKTRLHLAKLIVLPSGPPKLKRVLGKSQGMNLVRSNGLPSFQSCFTLATAALCSLQGRCFAHHGIFQTLNQRRHQRRNQRSLGWAQIRTKWSHQHKKAYACIDLSTLTSQMQGV